MSISSNSDVAKVTLGMINCTLPKDQWTHAAHFASALWLLDNSAYDPFMQMPEMIRLYNVSVGGVNSDTEGYHETITQASLRAAQSILSQAAPNTDLIDTLGILLDSEFGDPGWILTYWSKEVLFSASARRQWVDPDLKELPF